MKGITLATFRQYVPGASKAQLRAISDDMLRRIYRDGYWNKVRGDDLPAGLDLAVFDFAVNSGPTRAARYLQAAVGATQDGAIGPATLAAAKRYAPATVINKLCDARMGFLRGLPTFATFGKGWTRRISEVRGASIGMASTTPAASAPTTPRAPGTPTTPAGSAGGSKIAVLLILVAIIAAALFLALR